MAKIDTSGWKEFLVGELFDVVKGTRLTKANMIPGDIRFIGSSAMNNGCTAMVGNTENMHPANTITVCYNGSVGETFYDDKCVWDKAKLLTVTLPCTSDDEPDWAYMDEYMRTVMERTKSDLLAMQSIG